MCVIPTTNTLVLLFANPDDRFNLTIPGTDHQQHPLMVNRSLKPNGIPLIILTFLNGSLTTLTIVFTFEDKCGHRLRAIRPYLACDTPEPLLWIEHPAQGIQIRIETECHAFRDLDILTSIHKLSEA